MRPDFVSERNTPTLWKLAHEGVTFRHHHSVYPTMTYVNGAAMATGAYPNRNGLLANREFRATDRSAKAFETADPEIIKKGDDVTGGKYLALPTVAEIVRGAGRRAVTVGTKSVAFLHDRHAEWTTTAAKNFVGQILRRADAAKPARRNAALSRFFPGRSGRKRSMPTRPQPA